MPSRPPRIIHLANYGASYVGSFIPMVMALARAVRARGWSAELVFPESARGRDWLSAFDEAGVPYHVLDLGATGGGARWAAAFATEATAGRWHGRVAHWIAELLAADPGPTVLHTQFTLFDMPAAQAIAPRTIHRLRIFFSRQSSNETTAPRTDCLPVTSARSCASPPTSPRSSRDRGRASARASSPTPWTPSASARRA